jgi:RNase P subunit RPR2
MKEIEIKGFIPRLFCRHRYILISDDNSPFKNKFSDFENIVCKKCGNIKTLQINKAI